MPDDARLAPRARTRTHARSCTAHAGHMLDRSAPGACPASGQLLQHPLARHPGGPQRQPCQPLPAGPGCCRRPGWWPRAWRRQHWTCCCRCRCRCCRRGCLGRCLGWPAQQLAQRARPAPPPPLPRRPCLPASTGPSGAAPCGPGWRQRSRLHARGKQGPGGGGLGQWCAGKWSAGVRGPGMHA